MKNWRHKIQRLSALIMAAVLFAGSVDYTVFAAEAATTNPTVLDRGTKDGQTPHSDSQNTELAEEKSPETDAAQDNDSETNQPEESSTNPPVNESEAEKPGIDEDKAGNLPVDDNSSETNTPVDDDSDEKNTPAGDNSDETNMPDDDDSDEKNTPDDNNSDGTDSPANDNSGETNASSDDNSNDTDSPADDNSGEINVPANYNSAEKPDPAVNDDVLTGSETEKPDQENDVPEDDLLLPQNTDNTETENPETEIIEEFIDLGDTLTSVPAGISFFSLDNGTVDLKSGSYVKWIDRLDLPDYALKFYQALEEAVDNDGKDDFLINDDYFSKDPVDPDLFPQETYAIRFMCNPVTSSSDFDKESTYISKCMRAAYDAFDRDHPEVFWLSGRTSAATATGYDSQSGKSYFYFYFILKQEAKNFDIRSQTYPNQAVIRSAIQERENWISRILSSVQSTTDDESRIRALNNWLTKNNEYNTDLAGAKTGYPDAWECVSALEGRIGTEGPVCEGYARAFKVLCDRLNIPCVLVDGDAISSSGSGAHMWNYVELNDNWYATDVTWNDPTVSGKTGAVSGHETDKWLLLCSDSDVDGQTFISSHPVSNGASVGGVNFINGPQLATTADADKSSIVNATVTLDSDNYIYNGMPHEPTVTVTLEGTTLSQDTDYTVSYENNINAGTATITIKAKGDNYTGKTTATFLIEKANLSGAAVALTPAGGFVYDSTEKKPAVAVTLNERTLSQNTDYTVSYKNNINAGTATVTVTAKGNYEGTLTKNFSIGKAANAITLSKDSYTYKASPSKAQTFSIGATAKGGAVSYQSDNSLVTVNDSGDVMIPKDYAGTTKITVNASGDDNYEAATPEYVTIHVEPIDNVITASDITTDVSATVQTFHIDAKYSGDGLITYQSNHESVAVNDTGIITIAENFSGTAEITIHVAASGIYNEATRTITVTVKPVINSSNTNISLKDIPAGGYIYNGKPYKPDVVVTQNGQTLINGTDYTVSYQDNTNAGTATVTITATGDYQGKISKTFQIAKAPNEITLSQSVYTYNASASTNQTCSINAKATTGTIVYKTDAENVTISKGTVTIPKNYKGDIKVTVSVPESSNYNAAGSKTVTIHVNPIANTITASNFTKTASTAAQSFSIGTKRLGSGKITYSSNNKSVAVDSAGKVTIAKNFVGKATITIKVAASGIYCFVSLINS